MSTSDDAWTRTHDLALIYIALAYGTDYDLSDEEVDMITDTLESWRTDVEGQDVREIVIEAMTIYLENGAEVATSMKALKTAFTESERRRALEGIVRIAEADGILLDSERSLISTLASIWEIKAAGEHLLECASAAVAQERSWSLMHDVCLMYLVLAHSTDNNLSEAEISAMVRRLRDWEPDLKVEEIRRVLREALEYYAQEPGREALTRSVDAIKRGMNAVQRLALLDDLLYIAEVDGRLNGHEKEMIGALSRAWHVGVRLSTQAVNVGKA